MSKRALGKGLGALISEAKTSPDEKEGVLELGINEIEPNSNQPRKSFDEKALIQLSESIKEHGIIQPIIVKKEGDIYRIVAGERRWRAARLLGLKKIPAIVRDFSNKQVMEIALIENIQREDLNPIEEAEAYERLIVEHNMTQEQISNSIGKSRPAIANSLRLLTLSDNIKKFLISGQITSGHARALLSLEDKKKQESICNEIIEKNLSVRETEKLVKSIKNKDKESKKKVVKKQDEHEFEKVEEDLQNILGTKVKIINKNKKGQILIEYYSSEELNRLIELISNKGK
ncbi:ParB/RepB/Spo0J family partition protein [Acetivibrio saccincola]|jgi:ParB family chromosome partitioning protein|uniref:Chromosome partitioning protein ParB n=1 Tax=Acetivibrio saccincola TaxID=1677857 RepID=A0A2K9EKQ3_9FIRM|nr:ParB/RepB/Spo0J family partition protein [Acetivibrio saccincola]AUG56000.1 putative chromosome-partitioning protein ParB [Acetivibrio saccincola]NLW27764.1 ParB/RepB/Spo0J family partition protein [Acetivibrio saccincola]PQQ65811.1 chromosome partitioning protein ParB [Acetivibrio saccincola]